MKLSDQQLREDNFNSAAGYQSSEVDNSSSFGQDFLSGTWDVVDTALGISDTRNAIHTLSDPNSGTWDRAGAVGRIFLNVGSDILMVTGVGEVVKGGYLAVKGGLYLTEAATTKEANIETEITKASSPPDPYSNYGSFNSPPDPYASYGENGNQEGYIYDGAASSRVTSTMGTGNVVVDQQSVKIINKKYAGQTYYLNGELGDKYPNGVQFNKNGFPDFSPYSKATVKINGLTGKNSDFTAANKAVGLKSTPSGYTWHHVEDGKTMQLMPTDLHSSVRHTGGAAFLRKGLVP